MEPCTKGFFQPTLQAIIAIPDHALKERIDQCDQNQRGNGLGAHFGTLSNTTRDNCWNGGGKGEQEETAHQVVAMIGSQGSARMEKILSVCNPVAHKEIGNS